MTKENKHTYVALIAFFFILVILGTLENLPELTGIVSPTEDELPHLTLPALEG